jgi:tRNA pseudouridine55 synthase
MVNNEQYPTKNRGLSSLTQLPPPRFLTDTLCGILPIIKPSGITSYTCVRKLKRIVRDLKVGHGGTLDPLASGLLLILLGSATKLSFYLINLDKEYIARMRLGITTNTDDITGAVIKTTELPSISKSDFRKVLIDFKGSYYQVPPRFSAIKIKGQKGYELARQGIEFSPRARLVSIKSLELVAFNPPVAVIKTSVSKGTYIRALIRDIGQKLGCGATLEALSRTKIGKFTLKDAILINKISADLIPQYLHSPFEILSELPHLILNDTEIKTIRNGLGIKKTLNFPSGSLVRVTDEQLKTFIIARYQNNTISPERLIYENL